MTAGTPLLALGCAAAACASAGSAFAPPPPPPRVLGRTSPAAGGVGRSSRRRSSLRASSPRSERNEGVGGVGAAKKKRRRRRIVSPGVDYFTKQQLSAIFGSGGPSEWNAFVPLSLAGRWSGRRSTDDPLGVGAETLFLSSPELCEVVAEDYERCLQSNEEDVDSLAALTNKRGSLKARRSSVALPVPIPPSMTTNAVSLLSRAYSDTPLSKSVLLSLNMLFVNRDGGLFDNLPWATWSVDPKLSERDAAGNVIDAKFTMGKRVAYQRFMGKDWQGRSLSLGNLALRLKYLLEGDDDDEDGEGASDSLGGALTGGSNEEEEDAMLSLSRRLLELEIKEARMGIAECEKRLAISRTQLTADANGFDGDGDVEEDANVIDEAEATKQLDEARDRLQVAEASLEELTSAVQAKMAAEDDAPILPFVFPWTDKKGNGGKIKGKFQTLLISILDKLAEQENPPPYRGAIGYPAKLDTKEEVYEDSVLPYSSPYELLLEIIDEQLNSEVMGCLLEQTSLLEGNLVLGGALLLKRKGVKKSRSLWGEEVSYVDDEDSLGNEGVLPRSMYVVECFADEAMGVALACGKPLMVEEGICSRAGRVPVELDVQQAALVKRENGDKEECVQDMESLSFANRVPPLCPSEGSSISIQREGERISSEEESNLVRVPLTTNVDLFGGPNQAPQSSSSAQRSVFSTFNPVKSLDEYDDLTDDGKARLLFKLDSFTGRLPRPRAVRMSKSNDGGYMSGAPPSLLDDMLLPLVDESVRRQYKIRDAERRGDLREAEALREVASPRQSALEGARRAREEGQDDEAERLEEEARLLKGLRADITQDEGAYSRFLDRDDWYERETQARIKRLDKSKFGTLLDGID